MAFGFIALPKEENGMKQILVFIIRQFCWLVLPFPVQFPLIREHYKSFPPWLQSIQQLQDRPFSERHFWSEIAFAS